MTARQTILPPTNYAPSSSGNHHHNIDEKENGGNHNGNRAQRFAGFRLAAATGVHVSVVHLGQVGIGHGGENPEAAAVVWTVGAP